MSSRCSFVLVVALAAACGSKTEEKPAPTASAPAPAPAPADAAPPPPPPIDAAVDPVQATMAIAASVLEDYATAAAGDRFSDATAKRIEAAVAAAQPRVAAFRAAVEDPQLGKAVFEQLIKDKAFLATYERWQVTHMHGNGNTKADVDSVAQMLAVPEAIRVQPDAGTD